MLVLLTPLALTAIGLGFRASGLLSTGSEALPYGLFVLSGVVLWISFVEALHAPIYGVLTEQTLLARTTAAPEAVLLGKLAPIVVNLGLRTLMVLGAMLWIGVGLPMTLPFAVIAVVGLLALGLSIGIVLAPMNLIYRDVSRFLTIATTLWLFLTPVFYAPPAEGVVAAIMRWNPVTPLLSMARSSALGEYTGDLIPGAVLALGAGVLLLASWVVFRVALPSVLERSNA